MEAAAFLSAFRRRGKAEATLKSYGKSLSWFAAWAGDRDLATITADQIENEYLPWWEAQFELDKIERLGVDRDAGRRPAQNSLRVHLNALWLKRFDRVDRNPMRRVERVKAARRRNDWLNAEEDDAMLRACRSPQQRICTYLLRFTGLRVGEAVRLRNRDVQLNAAEGVGEIVVPTSKTTACAASQSCQSSALCCWNGSTTSCAAAFISPRTGSWRPRPASDVRLPGEEVRKIVAHRAGVRP